ncbi:3-carboxy-cis,cis-muconate cycloisomerase [Streptomyces roseifaciens]
MNTPAPEPPDAARDLDAGLLSTVRAGTPAEALLGDAAWLRAMLDAEVALARSQARLGVIPQASADAIASVANKGRFDLVSLAVRAREAANPVVALVGDLTRAVAAENPAAAEHVHFGSTSQDILDSAAMLVTARALDLVLKDLTRVGRALAALAAAHRDTPMAARTLTQHAVPTTFGLKAAGWMHAVGEAEDRLRSSRARLPVQLGGAAGTMAAYQEVAALNGAPGEALSALSLSAEFARELGLADPVLPWHTARIPVAGLGGDLALLAGSLGKFGLDVQNMVRTEVGEAAEPFVDGRGSSSAMPQKRNPVLSALLVSAGLQVPGYVSVLHQAMLAEDERPAGAWHAEWQPLREALRLAGGAAHTAAELAEGLTAAPGRMAENLTLTRGQVVAERLAVHLAAGMGKAEAKKHITRVAAEAMAGGGSFAEAAAADAVIGRHLSPEALAKLLDPTRYAGSAGELVDRALGHHRARTGECA